MLPVPLLEDSRENSCNHDATSPDMKFQMTASHPYAGWMAAGQVPPPAEPQWLSPDEDETWRALHLVISTLPGALGDQLRLAVDLSFLEYYVMAVLSEQAGRAM